MTESTMPNDRYRIGCRHCVWSGGRTFTREEAHQQAERHEVAHPGHRVEVVVVK